MFTLTIETENAAFKGDAATELARILRYVVKCLDNDQTLGFVHDINGNKVGKFEMEGVDE